MQHTKNIIIDSHCHLNDERLFKDRDQYINAALESGVKLMQNICTKISEFDAIYSIAEQYNCVYCSVGIHPLNVDEGKIYTAKEITAFTQKEK